MNVEFEYNSTEIVRRDDGSIVYEGRLKADAVQLAELYVFNRSKFTMMRNGDTFMPKSGGAPMKLTNKHLHGHLMGTCTVGVFAGEYSSKFMTFDVDDGEESLRLLLGALESVLKGAEWLGDDPMQDVHVSLSGKKGFHVDMFFDNIVSNKRLAKFYAAVIAAGELNANKIELRPTAGNSIKLPLGIHQDTGRRCCFIDKNTLEPIDDPAYIYRVRKIDHKKFIEFVDLLPAPKPRADTWSSNADSLNVAELPRVTERGTRHNVSLDVARMVRRAGYSKDEAADIMDNWFKSQNSDYIGTADTAVEKDMRGILDWVFADAYIFKPSPNKEDKKQVAIITAKDMAKVFAVRGFVARRVMFYLMVWNKVYGIARATGSFMAKVVGGRDSTLDYAIQRLKEAGMITVKRGKVTNNGGYKAQANTYCIADFEGVPVDPATSKIEVEVDASRINDQFDDVYFQTISMFMPWAGRFLTGKEKAALGAFEERDGERLAG